MTLFEHDAEQQEPSAAPAPASQTVPAGCIACSGGALAPDQVKAAFWEGERLVIVDGIPALVCQSCGERYYEDETAMKLDFMRGTGFPPDRAAQTMTVPVFQFDAPADGEAVG
ncbi:MAG: type II toxin-antitoxin system MqsA family antitoxin [Thalassovita sp.]|nr:type II toxin-antitoxin system MqsA family antitoxin [Thalassovita sp.]